MASTFQSSSSTSLMTVYIGTKLYLLSLLLMVFEGMIITPAMSSPTAVPPADVESILHSLRFQGMTAFADALDNIIWNHAFLVPASITLFIPMNTAMAPVVTSLNISELVKFLSYHIVIENLPVGRFIQLPVGTELNTMVGNNSLVVTENTKMVMTINHKEVMPKDLCTISTVACYAVKKVLLQESGARKESFGFLVAASKEAPILPPLGLPLPPLGIPVPVPPMGSPLEGPVPTGAPTPAAVPVPARASPTVFPPPQSPGAVPVPAGAPAVIVLPSPGTPGGAPLLSPGEAPGAAPEEAPSAAIATTASMATLMSVVMLTILVL